jgi:hypothetical protein
VWDIPILSLIPASTSHYSQHEWSICMSVVCGCSACNSPWSYKCCIHPNALHVIAYGTRSRGYKTKKVDSLLVSDIVQSTTKIGSVLKNKRKIDMKHHSIDDCVCWNKKNNKTSAHLTGMKHHSSVHYTLRLGKYNLQKELLMCIQSIQNWFHEKMTPWTSASSGWLTWVLTRDAKIDDN